MTTPVWTPQDLPYPLTVDELIPSIGSYVNKGDRLFAYKFWYMVEIATSPDDNGQPNAEPTTNDGKKKTVRESIDFFESPFEGTLIGWNIDKGDEIVKPMISICDIKRPCNHDVVYNGLCTICGKEVDDNEINVVMESANLSVSHTDSNLKISRNEATNLDNQLQARLRSEKKLVLVVDLDQTVIHCGVDPTIGEWKNDPNNPNFETLKDVKSFSLDEEPILPFMYVGEKRPPLRKCWYYVKVRPGLKEFFAKLAPLFEMHIYTMATRAYALEIAKIIDPDRSLFGDRILSRDENGSLTQKSLERLFPTDQSMVIIIDDRGDVWNWSPNLIKVIPYNFFVGVGDINSNFLPKQQTTMLQLGRRSREKDSKVKSSSDEAADEKKNQNNNVSNTTDELLSDIMHTEKKLQEKIDEEVKRQEAQLNKNATAEEQSQQQQQANQSKEEWTKKLEYSASLEVQQKNRPLATLQKHFHNQRLLVDDDDELYYLKDTLAKIHEKYYCLLESKPLDANIKTIMPTLKKQVFTGCHFVFSGLIPLNTNIQRADIVIWTKNFGAESSADIDENTTHVITKTPSTYKARLAKAFNPKIEVVHPDWIFECLITWERVNESPYRLIVEEPVSEKELEDYKIRLRKIREKEETAEEELDRLQQEAFESSNTGSDPVNLFGQGTSWLDDDEDIPEDDDDDENTSADSENEEGSDEIEEANTTVLDTIDSNKRALNHDETESDDYKIPHIKKPRTADEKNVESDSDLEEELMNMLDG